MRTTAQAKEMREADDALRESIEALRREMREGDDALRAEMRAEFQKFREEMNNRFNTLYIVIAAGWMSIMAAVIGLFIRG